MTRIENICNTISCTSSQETETDKEPIESKISQGSEQRGPTGSNSLVEEIYLWPTNLNNDKEEESWIHDILRTHGESTKENTIPFLHCLNF